jgi:lipopolysaccharide/colanic/teichoic acid biosynthesis glycosyltransferase
LLTDAQRLTRFGRFLRSTSLDELPELLTLQPSVLGLAGIVKMKSCAWNI